MKESLKTFYILDKLLVFSLKFSVESVFFQEDSHYKYQVHQSIFLFRNRNSSTWNIVLNVFSNFCSRVFLVKDYDNRLVRQVRIHDHIYGIELFTRSYLCCEQRRSVNKNRAGKFEAI